MAAGIWVPRTPRDPDVYTDLLCRLHPVGSPEHCVRTLTATAQRTGVEHLILMVETTGELPRTLETITRLGAEVLPRLRRQPVAAGRRGTPGPIRGIGSAVDVGGANGAASGMHVAPEAGSSPSTR